jgi:hypothetical protein
MSVSVTHACFATTLACTVAACGNTYVVPNGTTAASTVAEAGTPEVLELSADITISGSDDWQMVGQPGARCIIRGNGHSINSTVPWSGHFLIRSCDIVGLGTADVPGIHLNMHGTSSATIEDSTFDASGQVHVLNYDQSTTVLTGNTVFATSLVPVVAVIADSQPMLFAQGDGTGKNRFSKNLILKSWADFRSNNWVIGGDSSAEGNRFIGLRAGMMLEGTGFVVRGNYIHTIYPTSADLVHGQEVSPFLVQNDSPDLVLEHNVIRHGHWVLRSVSGEARYNAFIDADDTDWIHDPKEGTKIHHNVFVNYAFPGAETNAIAPVPSVQGGIEVIDSMTQGIEIWANTFDGGGPSKAFSGSTINISSGSAVDSVRSNLFMRFPYGHGSAGVAAGYDEHPGTPPRLGYADYNLFYNLNADTIDNYALPVGTKVERQDPGFGANDVPRLGAKDAQVDPQVTGPFVDRFPWTDDQIQSGAVTVTDMLAYFRSVYTPRPGSPLIDAGDPQDGPGADIGAIGAGVPNTSDRFGAFPAGSAPTVSTEGGVVSSSARRDSDGPLVLRCSAGPLARTGERASKAWIGLMLLLLSRLLITPNMRSSTFSIGSGRRRPPRATLAFRLRRTSNETRSTSR